MATLDKNIITDMGILSSEVYSDKNQQYFEFNENGQRIKSTITTPTGIYTIIDSADTSSSMQALLLKAPDGSFVIAFRGTQEFGDVITDLLIGVSLLFTGTITAFNAQRLYAEAFVQKVLNNPDYDITTSNLTLTGHSLGGILAQSIASVNGYDAYTFNALGTSGLTRFEGASGQNILNLSYTDGGILNGDPLSNALTFLGNQQVGAVLPMIGENFSLGAHSMDYMNMVIRLYNNVLENFTSDTTYLEVTRAYVENDRLKSFFGYSYEKTNQYFFTDVNVLDGSASNLSFNFLRDLSAFQIAQQSESDRAVLFALIKLNGFAVEGTLSSYNTLDLAKYSTQYIEDRSLLLFHMLDPVARPVGDHYFEDRGYDVHLGNEGIFIKNPQILFGADISETLSGDNEADHLYGMGGADGLNGNAGDDWIEGGEGADILDGGAGNDILIGGYSLTQVDTEADTMQGGDGYDNYFAGNGDTIDDSDGKGAVYFIKEYLTGGEKKAGTGCEGDEYHGNGGAYTLKDKRLTFIKDETGEILTIEEFTNGQLGITLEDNEADGGACPVEGACPKPVTPPTISLSTPTQSIGGTSSYNGIINNGPAPKLVCVYTPDINSFGIGGGPTFTSPIVLDLNRDGITSISLAASTALFDYDGDGIKETTAWIENTDALLVNDTNNDGIINNATELFGNYTKNSDGSIARSGYQALSYYDSNSDNVIDATDTRFNELRLWIDSNQDGVTNTGELKTLSDMGVTSLTLNSATPYIATTENINTIIQETTFTDVNGEGIMRDVLFRYENISKPNNGVYFDMDGNGIKEKMMAWTDPNQWMIVKDSNGDGKINNGSEIVGNRMTLPDGTKAADTIQALMKLDINHDGKVDTADNSGLSFWTDRNHNALTDIGELEALGAAGAIQVIKLNPYQTLLSGYDNGDGVIDNSDNVSNYLYIQTNEDNTITLYLPDNAQARAMIAGYTGGENIQTTQGEKIIKTIQFYSGYEMDHNEELNGSDDGEILEGSSRGETLRGMGGRDILDARAGDDTLIGGTDSDKLLGGAGNDTYIYNRSDGKDLIIDSAGTDTISFAAGITRDDLIIKSNGIDISIYLKDGVKPLSQLTDQIIIKDWYSTGIVESIAFSDGTTMDVRDMIAAFGSDKNDTIYGTENSETIIGGKGNDVLQGRGGSDTYLFARGDGKDTIIDTAGTDTILFGEGINADDLILEKVGNDIIIGIREAGKTFDQLGDTVTLKDWYTQSSRVDRFGFSDGTILDVNGIIKLMENVDDIIYGGNESESFRTLGGNDTVYAGAGDDIIDAGNGNDTIYGDIGNDTLIGGEGDDILYGGGGNDTYIFNRGDGNDTIFDSVYFYNQSGGDDTLQFGEGITQEDVIFRREGSNLQFALVEEGIAFENLNDKVTILNWYGDYNLIENFRFSDGTVIGTEWIVDLMGSDGDDTINGTANNETIIANAGNDIVYAGGGDDVISGGKGNDTLRGESGNDTYIFNIGDGTDVIYDDNGTNFVQFGEGIIQENIRFHQSGNSLIIGLFEEGKLPEEFSDKISVYSWFNNSYYQNISIRFNDGTQIDPATINLLSATYGSSQDDILFGSYADETLVGLGGNDIIGGNGGNDTYVFKIGDGKDVIYEYSGVDKIAFGEGISSDTISVALRKSPSMMESVAINYGSYVSDIAVLKNGNYVVVNAGNLAQMYNPEGTKTGEQFSIVEGYTITALEDGGFLVSGEKRIDNGYDYDVIAQRYNANGIAIGASFTVNSYRSSYQWTPDMVTLNDGSVVIVWVSSGQDGSSYGIYGKQFASDGSQVGGEFRINTYTISDQSYPSITALQDGGFVVAWQSYGEDGSSSGVYAQRYDSNNGAVGTEFRINDYVQDGQYEPKLAALQDGGFIATWGGDGAEGYGIYLKRYDVSGNIIQLELRVDKNAMEWAYNQSVAALKDGGYVLTWQEDSNSGENIFARIYDTNGIPKDEPFIVNDLMNLYQYTPIVQALDDGSFVIAWNNNYENTKIKRFDANGNALSVSDEFTEDLIISFKDHPEDEIVIKDLKGRHMIESFTFADGSTIGIKELNSMIGVDGLNGSNILESDEIIGTNGADVLEGGLGDDYLSGGDGADSYLFNRGDGNDFIAEYYTGNSNRIIFGDGIAKEDLVFKNNGWNLVIGLKEAGKTFDELNDTLEINGAFYLRTGVSQFIFANGEKLSFAELETLGAFEGSNQIDGTDIADTIYAGGGNDTVKGYSGNDIIDGGTGNDIIDGGEGNDVYLFNRGDGSDILNHYYNINNYYKYYAGPDRIKFGEGITKNDIIARFSGSSYVLAINEEGKSFDELSDKIILTNWNSSRGVVSVEFSDGSVLDYNGMLSLQSAVNETSAPIVFDLNGNGITSISSESNTTYFDYDGDGTRERTGWAERGDALLAVDVNHDGRINNGSELFGDHTKLQDGSNATDGYTAMLQYDSNNDGQIDSSDTKFNDLLLWKDTNLDGQSSADELSTLADNGIVSIDLSSNPLDITENGNRISYETTYTQSDSSEGIVRDLWFKTAGDDTIKSTDGEIADTGSFSDSFDDFTTDTTLEIDSIKSFSDSGIGSLTLQSRYTGSGLDGASAQTVFEGVGYTGTLSNVWLKSDTLDTQYTYNGTLSDDVKALPSISGQGNVINLQEAMNEKSELASSVSEFQNLSETGNLADFEANIDAIIERWALYDLSGESANSTPPIVLDLDGDGVTSTSLATSSAYFDYDGDGRREHTAWSDSGDALLTVDLDGDGVITHGAELFGNYTLKADGTKATDGYDAMTQYDTNGDTVLDASDAEFSKLRLWKDLNQNGKNDAGELSTLSENGISAMNLSRTDGTTFTQITEVGNTITNETNYTGSSGDGVVRDVWFSYDGTDTIAYSNLSDSDEKKIAIVENFWGRRLNSEERNSVEVIAEVLNQYNALRYDTIAKIITDKLYGEGFPNCQFLHDALNNTLGRVVGGAASTTETLLAVNLLAALLKREHVGVLADIYPEYFSNPTIAGLLAQSNIAIGFEEGALIGHIGNHYFGTNLAESLDFSALDGVRVYMSGGDDSITGTNGIDELVGGEGNDTLDGNSGNDVLEGGQGDDTLIGASTQNVYRYAWGDGNDTIIDAGSDDYAPDTLRLSDLDISRVSIERIGDDMIIHVRDEEGELLTPFDEAFGTITIKNGYSSGKIEHFYFKDTRYTIEEVLAYVPADTDYYFVKGDSHITIDEKGGEDTLHFGEGINKENIIARIVSNDLIVALAQEGRTFETLNDKITILNYTDAIEHFTFDDGSTMELSEMLEFAQAHLKITGSDESETLYGTAEGETFNAGAGDDSVYGEAGDDTYTFGLGDGSDIIVDTDGEDTILLKEGVVANDVTLALDGEDLIVSLSDGSEIRAVSWLSATGRIEHIKDSQGVSVDFSSVLKPVVENTSVEGDEDTLLEGSINVTDISGTPLVYAITTGAQNGTVEVNNETGEWTYVPNANFNGEDSVVVSVTNGYGITSTSTITLTIASVNDAPIIEGEDGAVTLRNVLTSEGQINAQDVDGDTLTYSIETQASHGTVNVGENGQWSYTTIDGYDGQDSAVIRIADGNGGNIDQTLNFTIIDNTAPEAPLESSNALQDIRILSGEVGATDIDGDTLSYTVSTEASHGILSVDENGVWNYSAADGYMGDDTAVITIGDANGGVITQTLNFNVQVSAPSLANATVNLFEDTSSTGTLDVLNPIGGALVYEVLGTSIKGEFVLDEQGNWNYNPAANLNGEDSVTIKVINEYGLSSTATLNFAIEAVNDTPVTSEQENYILQDIRIMNGVIEASDIDGDTLEYTIHTAPVHGEIYINAEGEWNYTPAELYMGKDSAIISISDGKGGLVTKTITFDNRVSMPSMSLDSLTLSEDTLRIESINVMNPVGGALSFEVVGSPQHGTISVDAQGVLEYTPSLNYHGSDSVALKVTNIYGLSDTRTIVLDILSVNDNPEASSEISNTLQDIRVLSGEVGATDVDGDVLSYTVSTAASHGVLNVDGNGQWNYAAAEGYMGTDSAVIAIDDGNGGVITQNLNFNILVSAPTLADSISNLLEDTNATGVLSVVNPIGGALVYEVLNASTKGSFSVNESGEWSYTPNTNLTGSDSITVKVTNAYGLSSTATLSLAIEAVNDAPILTESPSQVTLYAGSSTAGVIKASDVDGDVLSYSVTSNPDHGTLSIDDQGHWNYTAERYYAGESSATLTIDDGHGESITTTLNFANLMTPDWHYTYANKPLTINDNNGIDVLMMNTISMSELTFLQEGNSLRIDVKDKNDVILTDYFTSPTKGVESLQTKEGTINLSKEKIGITGSFWNFGWGSKSADLILGKSSADTIYAGEGNDTIFGNAGNDSLSGSNGNDLLIGGEEYDTLSGGNNDDILYGDNGNDCLSGEAGNDKLFGGKGNDTLSGGEGNDLLNGGEGTNSLSGSIGNDTYLFTKGANNTAINENVFGFNLFGRWIGQNGGNDTVKFGEGITKEDISFLMRGNDLLLQYGDSEFITIQNQKNEGNRIEKMQLNDGSYLTNTDMDKIIQQLSAYSKDHGFHITNNTQIQNNQALMNIVASGWHQ